MEISLSVHRGKILTRTPVKASYFQAVVATQPKTNTILQSVSNYEAANVLVKGSRPGALQQFRRPYTA